MILIGFTALCQTVSHIHEFFLLFWLAMGIQGMGVRGWTPWEGKRKRQHEISVCLFIYSVFSVTLPSIVSVSDCISADNCIRDMCACISRFVLTWGSLYLGFVTLCGTRFISCGNKQGMFVWWLEIKQSSAQYECKLRMSMWKEQKTSHCPLPTR